LVGEAQCVSPAIHTDAPGGPYEAREFRFEGCDVRPAYECRPSYCLSKSLNQIALDRNVLGR
jgi:hypothetical protein